MAYAAEASDGDVVLLDDPVHSLDYSRRPTIAVNYDCLGRNQLVIFCNSANTATSDSSCMSAATVATFNLRPHLFRLSPSLLVLRILCESSGRL